MKRARVRRNSFAVFCEKRLEAAVTLAARAYGLRHGREMESPRAACVVRGLGAKCQACLGTLGLRHAMDLVLGAGVAGVPELALRYCGTIATTLKCCC